MTLAALLLASALLDVVTMLALPPGAERNPLAIAVPPVAVALKLAVALSLGRLVLERRRYFRGIGYFATAAWLAGAAANVAVLA